MIRQGLKIVFNHEVKSPIFRDGQWHWQWQNQDYAHDILVLTNGNGLMAFEQSKGIPLYPVRGQVSQIPTTSDLQKLQCVVCYDGYLTPVSAENTHCLGASHVRNNDERHFSLSEHHENLAKLQQNMTACDWTKNIDLSANWAKQGVRAALRDRLPIVGAVPDYVAQKQQYANLYNAIRRKQAVENAKNFTQNNWLDLLGDGTRNNSGTIYGFREAVALLKATTNELSSNQDGTLALPENYGVGLFFMPAALAYYTGASNIPAYSPVIFEIKLLKTEHIDHDADGIPSINEINHQSDGIISFPDCNSNGVVDYLDSRKCKN